MKLFPTTTVIIQSAPSGAANIVWTETPRYRDSMKQTLALTDQLVLREKHQQNPLQLRSTLRILDSRIVPTLSANYPEPLKYTESFIVNINSLKVSRTGTPDGDHLGDAWTDGVPLNNGVNHGNESPLPTSGNVLSATSQFPYFKWTITTPRFTGLAHRTGVGTCTFSIWSSQGLAVVQTLNTIFWPLASNPFTESTINFTNQPVPPGVGTGNRVDRSVSILVGASNGRYDITLTSTEFAPFIGNWMVVRMDSSAVLATPINVVSREGAIGERPLLTFDFKKS